MTHPTDDLPTDYDGLMHEYISACEERDHLRALLAEQARTTAPIAFVPKRTLDAFAKQPTEYLCGTCYSKDAGNEHVPVYAAPPLTHKAEDAPSERTPQDYAIEHAEYMAVSGEFLIAAINDFGKALQEVDDGTANPSDVDAARETLSEGISGLLSGIYEFRKRRDRAAIAQERKA